MTDYEIMMVLAPVEAEKRVEFLSKAIACIMLACAEISKIDAWGEKQLAYHHGIYSTGYFYLLKFKTAKAEDAKELDDLCKREHICMQHMIVRKGK